MIPRIHKRGTSFKTAHLYILNDPDQQKTANRVDWAFSVNCGDAEPAEAWRAMVDTWDNRTALKREAGVDLRGADNKTPVMHYTLSWAPDDRPSKPQMMDAALKSLKALGLEDHQATIAAHNDTDHAHLHIIVNTVNPTTGRTAALKFPALALRDFAREHDRIRLEYEAARHRQANKPPPYTRNHEQRREVMAKLRPDPKLERIRPPHEPRINRRRALEHKDVVDRMKRHAAVHAKANFVENRAVTAVHRYERDQLYENTRQASHVALAHVRERFRSRWRDLYEAQSQEAKRVGQLLDKPLERAVYVFVNSERLGNGRALTPKEATALIISPTKLAKAVERLHGRERSGMAQVEKVEVKERLDRVWRAHDVSYNNLKARQQAEAKDIRDQQKEAADEDISYNLAKAELIAERRGEIPETPPPNAQPFETDAVYAKRVRREINTAYRELYGPDSVPRIPWGERTAPAPEPTTEPQQTPPDIDAELEALKRKWAQERDFDTGL
ncbi:MAG: hypothetical protein EBS23_04040 [Betaproteobacteria bacterium]|nr:hypothetical protein [Betaproteobacteria bacterium]